MAFNPGSQKRQKEAARRDHKRDKAARKEQRHQEAEERRRNVPPGVDPDIAGIIPGPQPPAEDV